MLTIFLSVVLITGCTSSPTQSTVAPTLLLNRGAVDLSKQLEEFREKQTRISVALMPTLTKEYEQKEIFVDASMLIELLLADPVYFSTYSNHAVELGVSVHIDGGSDGSFVYMVLETDHTIVIRFGEENYHSTSEALYDKVLEFAHIKNFDMEDLFGTQSIKLSYKQKNGSIKTVVIADKNKIGKLVALMYTRRCRHVPRVFLQAGCTCDVSKRGQRHSLLSL